MTSRRIIISFITVAGKQFKDLHRLQCLQFPGLLDKYSFQFDLFNEIEAGQNSVLIIVKFRFRIGKNSNPRLVLDKSF